MTIVSMYRDKELRPQQVDHQPHLFLAAVAAYVNQPVFAIVVDHVGFTTAEVIDYPVDALLVARNDTGTQHHGVAAFDASVFMVVNGRSGKSGHGLPLCTADQNHN